MDFNTEIGNRIRNIRTHKDFSLKELGEAVNLSEGTIQRYETGQIKGVDVNLLRKIAKALQVSPAYLMGWEEETSNREVMIAEEVKLLELIEKKYGKTVLEVINHFQILDEIDQAKIVERINTLLENEKYKQALKDFYGQV